jgi:hypothetical protein
MWGNGENSGLSLRLQYRVESSRISGAAESGVEETFSSYSGYRPIAWLDRDKLAALGFDVTPTPTSADTDTHYERMLGRDVLLVLELDGPMRTRARQAAQDLLASRQREIAASPEREESARRLRNAQEALQREDQSASRPFIVDAGLDQAALRQRYPDRTHYAIVHGNVRPFVMSDGKSTRLYGAVTGVSCETSNVPLQFRGIVLQDSPANAVATGPARAANRHPFNLEVAFGSRLEPWVVSGHAGPT